MNANASTTRGQPGSSGESRWIFGIDLVRGIAAMLVVLYHAHLLFWRTPVNHIFEGKAGAFFSGASWAEIVTYFLMGFGFLGVALFFVISGFCIHLPLAGTQTPLRVGPYAVRRFFRLYPLYFVVMCGAFVLHAMHAGWGKDPVTVKNFLGHMVFWYHNVPREHGAQGISMVFWSISVEVQFYILYALLLPVLRKVGFGPSAVVFIVLGFAYSAMWEFQHARGVEMHPALQPFQFSLARFGEWLLGAWIAERWARGTLPKASGRGAGVAAMVGGLAVVAAGIVAVTMLKVERSWINLPASIGFSIMLTGLLMRERALGVVKSAWTRAASWLGDRSYSLYLVHLSVLTVACEVLARVTKVDKNLLGGSWKMLVCILGGLVGVMVVTDITYRLIEKPSHKMARELGRRAAGKG